MEAIIESIKDKSSSIMVKFNIYRFIFGSVLALISPWMMLVCLIMLGLHALFMYLATGSSVNSGKPFIHIRRVGHVNITDILIACVGLGLWGLHFIPVIALISACMVNVILYQYGKEYNKNPILDPINTRDSINEEISRVNDNYDAIAPIFVEKDEEGKMFSSFRAWYVRQLKKKRIE